MGTSTGSVHCIPLKQRSTRLTLSPLGIIFVTLCLTMLSCVSLRKAVLISCFHTCNILFNQALVHAANTVKPVVFGGYTMHLWVAKVAICYVSLTGRHRFPPGGRLAWNLEPNSRAFGHTCTERYIYVRRWCTFSCHDGLRNLSWTTRKEMEYEMHEMLHPQKPPKAPTPAKSPIHSTRRFGQPPLPGPPPPRFCQLSLHLMA